MKIAVVPSNQHGNPYSGLPGVSEEKVMVRAGRACMYELQRQGVEEVQLFHVAGSGAQSTDELKKMIEMCVAWRPDIMLSLHSDAASGPRDVYPLIGKESDRAWAEKVGRNMAQRVGFAFQGATVRTIYFFSIGYGSRRLLLEIGKHNTEVDALFNYKYAEFLGVMAARALLEVEGKLTSDGAVSYPVPPGVDPKYGEAEHQSESGYFEGYPDGTFRWNENLTREQADQLLTKVKADITANKRGLDAVTERVEALEGDGTGNGPEPPPPPGPVDPSDQKISRDAPLSGQFGGTAAGLAATLPSSPVAQAIAPLYLKWARELGLRADLLWAQMCLETNNLKYGGEVLANQKNFCGLKTHSGAGYQSFASFDEGVRAHCEHMSWYVNPSCLPPCGQVDPRHLGPHGSNGWVQTLGDLDGKWAEAVGYADRIVSRAKSLGMNV